MIRGHRCIRQVGSGGMCTIYLAESERAARWWSSKVFNQSAGRFRALRQLRPLLAGNTKSLRDSSIKNIVRITISASPTIHAYIAMEHFPSGDLRQRMKAPLSPATALKYLEQIASALEAIHSVGVLHRDLKPANVMLRADGSLCLIDSVWPRPTRWRSR